MLLALIRLKPSSAARNSRSVLAVLEPADVPLEHLEVGQHMVGEEHRLGPLQVGVAGHDHTLIASS